MQLNYRKGTTDENIIKEIIQKQAYRKKKLDFKIENDDVWLDGGAHIGIFGLYAAQNGAKKVYCYEPEDENYNLLLQNITIMKSEYPTEITANKYAVNQNGGVGTFTIAPNTWRHSLMTHYKKKLPTQEINCKSLDEVLQTHGDINAIKLDIEGSELDILKNDHDFSNVKKLVFEYSFTKDRRMDNFFKCAEKLEKYFYVDIQNSFYNQKHQGQQGLWGGFIDAIIFCKAK
tara:strand:- start:11034 stop:11726 length:693 start_codon:yes stop_codon:yes gene_type:complete